MLLSHFSYIAAYNSAMNGKTYIAGADSMPQHRMIAAVREEFTRSLSLEKCVLHNAAQHHSLTLRQQIESENPNPEVIINAWNAFREAYNTYVLHYDKAVLSLMQQSITAEDINYYNSRNNGKFNVSDIATSGIRNRMKNSLFAENVEAFLMADTCNLSLLIKERTADSATKYVGRQAGGAYID